MGTTIPSSFASRHDTPKDTVQDVYNKLLVTIKGIEEAERFDQSSLFTVSSPYLFTKSANGRVPQARRMQGRMRQWLLRPERILLKRRLGCLRCFFLVDLLCYSLAYTLIEREQRHQVLALAKRPSEVNDYVFELSGEVTIRPA